MKNKTGDPVQKARNYAFLLLKFRPRSEKEICLRLRKKKFTTETIDKTLSFLKDKGFINDGDFARAWVEARLKKPFGIRRISQELRLKGIDRPLIDCQIDRIKQAYPEKEIVSKIVLKKLKAMKGVAPDKIKRRVYGYLLRRGFSPDIVIETLSKI